MESSNHNDIVVKGVGGWLLFFCVIITIFSPLMTLINITYTYPTIAPYFKQFPKLKDATILGMTLNLALMFFGIYAGLCLWRVVPRAVKITKKYLITSVIYAIITVFLPVMAELPKDITRSMMLSSGWGVFQTVLFVVIFYKYLNESKRVRATYIHEQW